MRAARPPKWRKAAPAGRKEPFRLLFVCTGNSARSQLAEGLAAHLGEGRVEAHSAGTMPAGVSSYAVAAMRERGIDISGQTSKGIEEVPGPFDLVVTLCDNAAALCPASTWSCPREHWPTPDPSFVAGGPEALRRSFREVRDRLEEQIAALLDRLRVSPGAR